MSISDDMAFTQGPILPVLVEEDLYILPSGVERHPADNSCLYHSLASGLHRCFPHLLFDSTSLRSNINFFIASNPSFLIRLGPSVSTTIADAINSFGDSTLERYLVNQSNLRSWGGIIEIAICVAMYSVNIFVFRPVVGSDVLQAFGTFVSSSDDVYSSNIYLLYSGFNHYDSIFDFAYVDSPFGLSHSEVPISSYTLFQNKSLSYKSIIGTRQCTNYRRPDVKVPKVVKKKVKPICKTTFPIHYRSRALLATNRFLKRYTNYQFPVSNLCSDMRTRSIIATNRFFRKFPLTLSSVEYTHSKNVSIEVDVSERISNSSSDAKAYADSYDSHSKYVVCAICGIEGSRSGSVLLSDIEDLINGSGISSKFSSISRSVCTDNVYDVIFKRELNRFFDNGLIRGINTVCQTCYRFLCRVQVKGDKAAILSGVKSASATSVSDDSSSDDDSVGRDFKFSLLPKYCLFRGLFTGSIPEELTGLTLVEESMINIYSAITNVSLAGGKHWQQRGGTCYTIINDLTSVAKQLPRMPSADCIAILRHVNTKLSKDYTYRPNRVYRALQWLKINNHLYENVTLCFPCDLVDWENDGSNIDIPFVELCDEEIVEINEGMGLGSVPCDFVSSNPASVGYDSEVLLEAPDTLVTMLEDLREALIEPSNKPLIRTTNHEFVCQYKNPEYYFSRCFASLYPYGRGCPSDENCLKISIANYIKFVLTLGGGPSARRFQQNSKFIFTSYTMEMKRKLGCVAYLAQRKDDDNITEDIAPKVKDVNELLSYLNDDSVASDIGISAILNNNEELIRIDPLTQTEFRIDEIEKLIKRLIPYSKTLQGSMSHIQYERGKLMAMIPSPLITNNGSWRLFFTNAPSDLYESRFYDIVTSPITDSSDETWISRQEKTRYLSEDQRITLLRQHPAVFARLYDKKQDCFWDDLLLGKQRPLGLITDYWRRVEFQARGTPHVHSLICISNFDGISNMTIESSEKSDQKKVLNYVSSILSANLVSKINTLQQPNITNSENEYSSGESDYEWSPPKDYFDDMSHPNREYFDHTWNYERKFNGEFADCRVHNQYRLLQIANQCHRCCFTCFKYCLKHDQVCRFGFPWLSKECIFGPVIQKDRDKKNRVKINVLPQRNNAHINTTLFNPLLSVALGSNHDIQYIGNTVGAAEYVASYASKSEAPDKKIMANIFNKKLKTLSTSVHSVTDRERLYSVGCAILGSSTVGSVQACYSLLGLKFVKSSRVVVNVNSLHRDVVTRSLRTRPECIKKLADSDSAFECGPNTTLGKRNAYEVLVIQQRSTYAGECNITYFNLLTSYTLSSSKVKMINKLKPPPLLKVDKFGTILISGNNSKFLINNIIYTKLRKACVVNLCPYVPINDSDEASCYSNLLMHYPWPLLGENFLIPESTTSVQYFAYIRDNHMFPEYVRGALEKYLNSDTVWRNVGTVVNAPTDNLSNDYCAEDNSINFVGFTNEVENPLVVSQLDIVNNNGIIKNITFSDREFCKDYIKRKQKLHMNRMCSENSTNSTNNCNNIVGHIHPIIKVDNYDERVLQLEQNVSLLTLKQLEAYNIAVDYISGKNKSQMLMFVSGEGGTGKSFLIALVMEYSNLFHGKQNGIYGAAVAVAPTGSAANVIKGFTWHSVYGKGINKTNEYNTNFMSGKSAQAVGAKMSGVKILIIDEISMINLESLYEISQRHISSLCTQISDDFVRSDILSKPFGGTHVLFTGDFYQLQAVGGQPIYCPNPKSDFNNYALKGREIWLSLNHYIELTENTRYRNDSTPHMNLFLKGARIGNVDKDLLLTMNERIVTCEFTAMRTAGPGAVWITHTNADVKRLNKLDFELKIASGVTCLRIWADHKPKTGFEHPDRDKTEELCKFSPKHGLERYLDLAIGSRVHCTINLGTQIGIYNGAKGTVVGFAFQSSTNPVYSTDIFNESGIKMEIPVVFVKMDAELGFSFIDSMANVVPFTDVLDEGVRYDNYQRWQLPLTASFATTTHKMQGSTVFGNCVTVPWQFESKNNSVHLRGVRERRRSSVPFCRGLDYVAHSRARDLASLFILGPLTPKHFTSHPTDIQFVHNEYKRLRNIFNVNISNA